MSSKEHVCHNYVSLKPEEATLTELIRALVFSSDLDCRKFIDSSEEDVNLERRWWVILVSIVVQRLFLLFSVPLARIGDVLQKLLNLVSVNGGPLMLLLNWLKACIKVVETKSISSRSLVGNLNWRIDLDKNIRPENARYKASLSMMASKMAYDNGDVVQSVVNQHWMVIKDKIQRKPSCSKTQSDPNLIVVAFRGTSPFDADSWMTDFDLSWCEFNRVGKAHSGFMKALGMQPNNSWPVELETDQLQDISDQAPQFAYYTIRKMLVDLLQEDENAKFIVTGHSLGGVLAIMFAGVLAMHDHEYGWLLERMEGVYTFGQPRVGDEKFGEFMKGKFRKYDVRYMRYVYCYDLVPRIPFDDQALLFKHFGPSLYFNSCYRGKVLEEEPDKNYFSLCWFIPKRLNAVWELIRGFILPWVAGPEYNEGWFMRFWRLVGLVIPGLGAHAPQVMLILQDWEPCFFLKIVLKPE